MKQLTFFALLIVFYGGTALSQTNTFPSTGNAGIGTTTPAEKLTIAGPSGNNIYIGNTIASGYNGIWLNGSTNSLDYNMLSSANDNNLYINRPLGAVIRFRQANLDHMIIGSNGNVGIGTDNPTEKLAVNGNIITKKVKVTQSGWADYVFHLSYRLPSLQEVEAYIKQHQHLPEIPSAAEVEKNGLDLGENQATLLKKIEELTLNVIELKKENIQMAKDIQQLQKK